jgi:hypothetical protein
LADRWRCIVICEGMKGILDSTGEAIMKPIISAFLAMIIALFGFGFRAMGQSIKVGVVTPLTGR